MTETDNKSNETVEPPKQAKTVLTVVVIAIGISLGALGLGIMNAVLIEQEGRDRENERIASDLLACVRVNELRLQIVEVGSAQEELIMKILDEFLGDTTNPRFLEFHARLDPLFEAYEGILDDIQQIDCLDVVPGSERLPNSRILVGEGANND